MNAEQNPAKMDVPIASLARFDDSLWLGAEIGLLPPDWLSSVGRESPSIDCGPTIAFPGLINSHDHLGFNCYPNLGSPPYNDFVAWSADVHRNFSEVVRQVEAVPHAIRVRVGILKNLLCGV